MVNSTGTAPARTTRAQTTLFSLSVANTNSGLLTTERRHHADAVIFGIVVGREVGGNRRCLRSRSTT